MRLRFARRDGEKVSVCEGALMVGLGRRSGKHERSAAGRQHDYWDESESQGTCAVS